MKYCIFCKKACSEEFYYCPKCGSRLIEKIESGVLESKENDGDKNDYNENLASYINSLNDSYGRSLGYTPAERKEIPNSLPIFMALQQKGSLFSYEMYRYAISPKSVMLNFVGKELINKAEKRYLDIFKGKIDKAILIKEADKTYNDALYYLAVEKNPLKNKKIPYTLCQHLLDITRAFRDGGSFYYYDKSAKIRYTLTIERTLSDLYRSLLSMTRYQDIAITYTKLMNDAFNICCYMAYLQAFLGLEDLDGSSHYNKSKMVEVMSRYDLNYKEYRIFYRYSWFALLLNPKRSNPTPFSECKELDVNMLKYIEP